MKNRQNFVMEALPTLFYSSLYRSFIIAVEKLLYEYRPKGLRDFLYLPVAFCVKKCIIEYRY